MSAANAIADLRKKYELDAGFRDKNGDAGPLLQKQKNEERCPEKPERFGKQSLAAAAALKKYESSPGTLTLPVRFIPAI